MNRFICIYPYHSHSLYDMKLIIDHRMTFQILAPKTEMKKIKKRKASESEKKQAQKKNYPNRHMTRPHTTHVSYLDIR